MATREDNINKIISDLKIAEKGLEQLSDEQLTKIVGGSDYVYGNSPKYDIGQAIVIDRPNVGILEIIQAAFGIDYSVSGNGIIRSVKWEEGKWLYSGDNTTKGGSFFNVEEQYIRLA